MPVPRKRALKILVAVGGLVSAAFILTSVATRGHGCTAFLLSHVLLWRTLASLHPVAAPVAFALIFALCLLSFLPLGLVLTAIAGFVFGPLVGAASAVVGAVLAAGAGYSLARSKFSRPLDRWLSSHAGAPEDLRARLRENAFGAVLSIRLIPFAPFTLVSLLAGIVMAPMRLFLAATALGVIPECTIYALTGREIGALLSQNRTIRIGDLAQPNLLAPMVLGALGVLLLLRHRWRRGTLATAPKKAT